MIRFEDITHQFGDGTVALENINLKIEKGEFVFITGPSGAGKTTLLRLLIREFLPTRGKIFLNDLEIHKLSRKKIAYLRRQIGVVYQDFKILFDRTVWENVTLALEIVGRSKAESQVKTQEVLKLVGLTGKENLFPRQLAGGEIQRLGLARAVVIEPEIIFADEPTGNLDPHTAWQIVELLQQINKQEITVIMATHNFEIVDSLKKRVIRLEKGKIVTDEKRGKYKK